MPVRTAVQKEFNEGTEQNDDIMGFSPTDEFSEINTPRVLSHASFSETSESSDGRECTDDEATSSFINNRMQFRKRTSTELERKHFKMVNDRVVNDITLEALYKPHTLTALGILCTCLIYKAFSSDFHDSSNNIFSGIKALIVLFLVISAMVFPNGPFIRPHPIFWRIIFGISVLYTLLLQFTLYQSFADVKRVLSWLDPVGLSKAVLEEKDYAVNCSSVSFERFMGSIDIFVVAHFFGWVMKALLIRHSFICWYISIAWELTEVFFAHLLPNFQECWWDAIFLDILLCNGLGILVGMWLCRRLEMRQFHWESIKNIRNTRGRLKRAVMQFTPESWMRVDWLCNIGSSNFGPAPVRRCFGIFAFIMVWLITELNTFFLKHILAIDTSHSVVCCRLLLIVFISAPSIRQYYLYLTDPKVKRIGMQCWIYCAVCALEAAICVKFGREQLPSMKIALITLWIGLMAIGTVFCVWLSVMWAKHSKTMSVSVKGGGKRECYLDSSTENLGAISEDVRKRRKKLNIPEYHP